MPDLPARFAAIIITFAPLFTRRSWLHAQVLLVGAILAPGRRTVASVLRITGHARDRHFTNYHRVLSRAPWNARDGARCLLGHLVRAFAPRGPIIVGLDDTIERRWGSRIAARGIYRDPVRSSHSHFVKTSGLRWISLMLLAPIPWAGRVWALPFLTALVPSEQYNTSKGRRHKTLLDFGRQLALQARRWLPDRDLVLVADSSFSSLLFLHALRRRRLTVVTRLRLDAALYDLAPPRKPGTMGRPRKAGRRLATLARVAADTATPWLVLRVEDWYGGGARDLQIVSATAVWHHHGLSVVPIRWVLIRDPMKPDAPAQALLCTDLDRTPQESSAGLSAAGASKPRSGKSEPTSASRHSASGPIAPSPARRPACWPCSRSSPCWPHACPPASAAPPQRRPGTTRRCRPSPTPSRLSAAPSGANSISKRQRGAPTATKSRSDCQLPGPTPSATQPEKAKVKLRARIIESNKQRRGHDLVCSDTLGAQVDRPKAKWAIDWG